MALPIRTLAAMAVALPLAASANTGVTITSYGHSALLIQGGGATVLLNPFKAVGCAAGLAEPRVSANVILASSLLLDEGASVASGRLLSKPGSYRLAGLSIEGISAPHDRFGGRRFGQATLWRWKQGGLVFAHLGGTAAKLSPEVPQSRQLAPLEIGDIKEVVCKIYGVHEETMASSSRGTTNEPRDVAMFLARTLRGDSLNRMAAEFRIEKYSTVASAISRIKMKIEADQDIAGRVERCEREIEKRQKKI